MKKTISAVPTYALAVGRPLRWLLAFALALVAVGCSQNVERIDKNQGQCDRQHRAALFVGRLYRLARLLAGRFAALLAVLAA